MSVRVFDCPQCGAPVTLRSITAVFAVCEHCRSMVVVRDAQAELIGVMAALPPDLSPFQIGSRGEWKGRGFEIVGRVRVEWDEGSWNEWCILYDATQTGWLAEAQGLLMISFATEPAEKLPAPLADYVVGKQFTIEGERWTVSDVKEVRCQASEGELPMSAAPETRRVSVDLSRGTAGFASIELDDASTEVYVGEYAAFDDLKLANLRPVPGWNAEVAQEKNRTTALSCPNCGAAVQLRAAGLAMSAVCSSCGVVIDTANPQWQVIQKADIATRNLVPFLPIGQRGKLFGTEYEVIGFVRREDKTSSWAEYLLFNPWQGFRWLVSYQGHWSFIERLPAMPDTMARMIECEGRDYRFYAKGKASVTGVLGEFYWKVRRGESADVYDYIAPPYILSKEVYSELHEFTWSRGEYVEARVIGEAFGIKNIPYGIGLYLNQPDPFEVHWKEIRWPAAAALLCLIFLQFYFAQHRPQATLADAHFIYVRGAATTVSADPAPPDSPTPPTEPGKTFTTPHFTLSGGAQRVDIEAETPVDNDWIGLDFTLVNAATNAAIPAALELSYYHGFDDGESWSEGSQTGQLSLPAVPPGEYYLTIEPSTDPQSSRAQVPFSVRVQGGGLFASNLIVMLGLVLFYPGMLLWRRHTFEIERWQDAGGYPWEDNG